MKRLSSLCSKKKRSIQSESFKKRSSKNVLLFCAPNGRLLNLICACHRNPFKCIRKHFQFWWCSYLFSVYFISGTLPLWLFTLGQTILKDTNIVVPYRNVMLSLVGLVIPLSIGLLIQRFLPKIAARSKKLLLPICIILIIGIIVLAAVANTYIFFLLSWQIVIAASISVWTGFLAGILVSLACRFPASDVIAVSIETGIQNTGIAFVLLSYSLDNPVSDMAAVVPVAGSMITPIPLFVVFCYMKLRKCWSRTYALESQTLSSQKGEYQSTRHILNTSKEQELNDVSKFK